MESLLVTSLLVGFFITGNTQSMSQVVECTTLSGEHGSCILLESCAALVRLVSSGSPGGLDAIRRSQCGFIGAKPKVCCANNPNPIHFLDSTTESDKTSRESPNSNSAPTSTQISINTPQHIPSSSTNNFDNIHLTKRPDVNSIPDAAHQSPKVPEDKQPHLNHRNDELPSINECGLITISNKIYGGKNTSIDDFPWMVLLKYNSVNPQESSGFYGCAGTLINHRYVMTAAHCILTRNQQSNVIEVRLGEWNLETAVDCDDEGECNAPPLDVGVEQVIVHEDFHSANLTHDIALIRLARDVQYSDWVQPICLPGTREMDFTDESFWVAGWGQTQTGRTSPVKLKLEVQYVPQSTCRASYRRIGLELGEDTVCAGGRRAEDTCAGDSGGSLMKALPAGPNSNMHAVGVVSLGPSKCGLEGWAGVYTRVGSYVDWIKSKLRR